MSVLVQVFFAVVQDSFGILFVQQVESEVSTHGQRAKMG
jgi:hypothetical protein